jgi:preprotein translocase subunit SecA
VPSILNRILRAGEGKILKQLTLMTDQVNRLEDDMVTLSDAELRGLTDEFRSRLADGETLDDLLPEAFATVREAAKRTLGQRHYDVQIMGGGALHLGNIAEMRTGEGKTLVATLPAYLNALDRQRCPRRHGQRLPGPPRRGVDGPRPPVPRAEVGVILAQMPAASGAQYAADITYGTNNEFGFDYLRDNMAMSKEELVQRGHHFAIVDEVDSILIDEARTPLIISGPADQPTKWYGEFARLAGRMSRDVDYEVDEKKRTVGVLEPGIAKVEDWLGIDNLYESANTPLIGSSTTRSRPRSCSARQGLRRHGRRGLIVDEHTGRMLSGRRYNEGMHQAIEAKEGVEIKQENQTLATITLQNFFRLYDKLSGMTGTAMTEASEFDKIYSLGVVPIPTNREMVRTDQSDLIYRTEDAKFTPCVEDIVERHAKGQPVLVGTASVEKSEQLSELLRGKGIPHEVLNAKQHAREAAIVAQAGRKGAVTVATNMAGRGTDIMLGGNPEVMAADELRSRAWTRPRPPRSTRPPGARCWRSTEARWPRSTRRSSGSAGCTCSAPSGTSRAGSTTSCADDPAARATPGSPASTSRCRTSSCGGSRPPWSMDRALGYSRRQRPAGVQGGQPHDRSRAEPGRGAVLRDPQGRPQVRRRAQPPARGDLRRAPPRPRG